MLRKSLKNLMIVRKLKKYFFIKKFLDLLEEQAIVYGRLKEHDKVKKN